MGQGGNASITVVDGGSATISVPGAQTQLVLGCCSGGTVGQIIATKTPSTLGSNLGVGPLPEAAALALLGGGTVLAMKVATATAGTAGTVTASQGTGASPAVSVMTVTGVPVDTYYVRVLVVTGGTIGTAGVSLQVSFDAGRNYGPVLALGTATTLALGTSGMTLSFTTATIFAGNVYSFGTTEPLWNTAGIQAALNTFQASQYAIGGVGSTHIVGVCNGANATAIQAMLDTLATGYVYTRSFMTARDASPQTAYSGTAETEAVWMMAIQTDYSATAARRLCVGAAYWNMPSAFPLVNIAGASAYRRPIAWAAAARQVGVTPQRHIGRVRDGSLVQIVVNPTSDPLDGFIYHDERINPGNDYLISGTGGRFMSTMTRTGLPGVYISNPLTAAPLGSDYYLMPLGTVMDIFCATVHQIAQQNIDDDVRLNANGTIYENDARSIEAAIANAVNSTMFSAKMISQPVGAGPGASTTGASVIVDRTVNVKTTGQVNIVGQIVARGYVLQENISLSYQNPLAAS